MLRLEAGLVLVPLDDGLVLVPQEEVRVQLLVLDAARPAMHQTSRCNGTSSQVATLVSKLKVTKIKSEGTRKCKIQDTSGPFHCSAGDILRQIGKTTLPCVVNSLEME